MAVLPIRCSSSFMLSRLPSAVSPNSSLIVSFKTHLRGRAALFPVDVEMISGSTDNTSSPISLSKATNNDTKRLTSSVERCVGLIHLSYHRQLPGETIGAHQLPLSAAAIFVANILGWTSPMEALAETCETDSSFKMPVLLFVALIGATVGGLLARQRRGELKRLNEQLRQINSALRRQAKIESYAPTLSYAPTGSKITEDDLIVDPRKPELISRLKSGKNFLRIQDPEQAFLEFKNALDLARSLKDPIEEKKAARGLGASLQRQGKYRDAINYHSMVLAISSREGEDSGNTEAYGAIADCYTELGDLERAAGYYDKYIARLEKD